MVTGEFEAFVSGRGYDLYRIREYMPDDSARHVDWKATARTGALKVREFSREDERKLRIVFDNPAPGVLAPAAYERAVRMAASLGWHFHHDGARDGRDSRSVGRRVIRNFRGSGPGRIPIGDRARLCHKESVSRSNVFFRLLF